MSEQIQRGGEVPDSAPYHDRESVLHADELLEVRLWLRLLTCTTMIERDIRTRLHREFDITLARFDVLAQLERASGGLTMSGLSQRMMVSHGNVTGLVDRLVEDELVARQRVDGDRRALRVVLTKNGRAAFRRMAKIHHGWLSDLLADLPERDRSATYDMLGHLKAALLAAAPATSAKTGR